MDTYRLLIWYHVKFRPAFLDLVEPVSATPGHLTFSRALNIDSEIEQLRSLDGSSGMVLNFCVANIEQMAMTT